MYARDGTEYEYIILNKQIRIGGPFVCFVLFV